MSGVKRTRNSSELGPRKHDGRKKEVSQNANCWLGSQAEVKEKTPDEIRNDSKRRRVQKEGEWEIRRGNLEDFKCGSSSSSSNVDVFDSATSNVEKRTQSYEIGWLCSYEVASEKGPTGDRIDFAPGCHRKL